MEKLLEDYGKEVLNIHDIVSVEWSLENNWYLTNYWNGEDYNSKDISLSDLLVFIYNKK